MTATPMSYGARPGRRSGGIRKPRKCISARPSTCSAMYKDPEIDLFLKTEQLLYFRLTFALVSLGLCLILGWFTRTGMDLFAVGITVGAAATYSLIGLVILAQGKLRGEGMV